MPHPLLPLPQQHLVVLQLLKMLGIQVHGIRSFTRTSLYTSSIWLWTYSALVRWASFEVPFLSCGKARAWNLKLPKMAHSCNESQFCLPIYVVKGDKNPTSLVCVCVCVFLWSSFFVDAVSPLDSWF